jgi:phosphatidylserine/phosphatidylglycerophosphate/cardiolipin synthase-like enzyme
VSIFGPNLGRLQVDQLFTYAAPAIDELAGLIGGADHEVVGEVFKLTNPAVLDAIADRAPGVRATLLHDPDVFVSELFAPRRARLAESGAQSHLFGDVATHKLHTKSFVADAERGWLSTAAIMRHGVMLDFSATVSNDAARALRQLTISTIEKGRWGQRRAAAAAARQGILLNDRSAGITHLTQGVNLVIDSAQHELVIATKMFNDADLARRIARRAQEGVDVFVATQSAKMSGKVRAILADSNVRVVDDVLSMLHGNAAVADGQLGYFGTGHLSQRAMGDPRWRASREIGALVEGEHAVTIRDAIRDFSKEMPPLD